MPSLDELLALQTNVEKEKRDLERTMEKAKRDIEALQHHFNRELNAFIDQIKENKDNDDLRRFLRQLETISGTEIYKRIQPKVVYQISVNNFEQAEDELFNSEDRSNYVERVAALQVRFFGSVEDAPHRCFDNNPSCMYHS